MLNVEKNRDELMSINGSAFKISAGVMTPIATPSLFLQPKISQNDSFAKNFHQKLKDLIKKPAGFVRRSESPHNNSRDETPKANGFVQPSFQTVNVIKPLVVNRMASSSEDRTLGSNPIIMPSSSQNTGLSQPAEKPVVVPHAGSSRAVFVEGLGLVCDFMPSDDLNECVDALMQKKSKAQFQHDFT